jgi:plastocyanin
MLASTPQSAFEGKGIALKLSRARLRALVLAATAAALALAISGPVSSAAVTPTGKTDVISIELTKGKLKFVGPETVTAGDQLEVVNDTNPKQVGPHTFSLVTKGSQPKTRKAQQSCFTPKKICFAIAKWHGFNPKTERISKNLVKAGPAGWSTMGNATGKTGDSWFTGEKKKGTHVSQEVTAEPGTTLYYICAVHPEMQGSVKVEAPVVPLPVATP